MEGGSRVEFRSPDVADQRVLLFLLLQQVGQMLPHAGGVSLQVLFYDDVEDRQPDGARHRVTAKLRGYDPAERGRLGRSRCRPRLCRRFWSYRVEILHSGLGEGLGHLGGGDHTGHGVAVTDGLPHGDDVGDEVGSLELEGPEMAANAPEAHLDLIGDDHAPGPADVPAGEGSEVTAGVSLASRATSGKLQISKPHVCGVNTHAATCWK